MAMHDQVDAAAFVTEWWENADGRWLPGEEGGYNVFTIDFWDGCRYFDYTQGAVFERVSELGYGPVEVWRNKFVSEHMGQMAYVVRCMVSDLARADAVELVNRLNRLVVAAPVGMLPLGGGAVEHRACFLGENLSMISEIG